MYYFISLFIFVIILFFYIHIFHHYKTSNDLEVYTIDNPSRDKIEEICNLGQPIVFNLEHENLNIFRLDLLSKKYGNLDIQIRNINEKDDDEVEVYLPFDLKNAKSVLRNKENNDFITENNTDFLKESGLLKLLNQTDGILKPPMMSNSYYDFISGSLNTTTPLRYDINYRNYLYVTEGTVKMKLLCPSNTRFLNQIKDYENFEFRSNANVWCQDVHNDLGDLKILDIELKKGSIIFIPAYWWCSIKFGEASSICSYKYRTYMNNIAILPEIILHFLQRQNIKHNSMKKFKFSKTGSTVPDQSVIKPIQPYQPAIKPIIKPIQPVIKPIQTEQPVIKPIQTEQQIKPDKPSKRPDLQTLS